MLVLLGERSQRNSYFKHIISLYLYATGASRQAISVAAHLGVGSAYSTITSGPDSVVVNSDKPQESTVAHEPLPALANDTTDAGISTSTLAGLATVTPKPKTLEAQEPFDMLESLDDASSESGSESKSEGSELEWESDTETHQDHLDEVVTGPSVVEDEDSDSEDEPLLNKVNCLSFCDSTI